MNIKIKEWIFTVLAFILFFYLYSLFSYFSVQEFIEDGFLKDYLSSNAWHLEILLTSLLFGTLFSLINRLTEKRIFRKHSFGFNIIIKTVLYLLALVIVAFILLVLFLSLNILDKEALQQTKDNLISFPLIASFIIYWMLFVLLVNFIISISYKFGPRTFIDLLIGKYYHPKSEKLIFLFLDLKDSTRLAEKLDHHTYSRFIKDCFHELTPVVVKTKARIYQYVGDEVILYWNYKDGLKNLNCLNAFFDFKVILVNRQEYFLKKYGETPSFKAGMAAGNVTLTEIGDVKREIAFHGDVLNTAARLEKKCNEYDEEMIVTQKLVELAGQTENFEFKFLSNLPLKGKSKNIGFYSVIMH